MFHRYFSAIGNCHSWNALFWRLLAMPTLNAILLEWVTFVVLLKLDFLAIWATNSEWWFTWNPPHLYTKHCSKLGFSERKQKKAKMWVREPSIGWLVPAFEYTVCVYFLSLDSMQKKPRLHGKYSSVHLTSFMIELCPKLLFTKKTL